MLLIRKLIRKSRMMPLLNQPALIDNQSVIGIVELFLKIYGVKPGASLLARLPLLTKHSDKHLADLFILRFQFWLTGLQLTRMRKDFTCYLHSFYWREEEQIATRIGVSWVVKLICINNRCSGLANIEPVGCRLQVILASPSPFLLPLIALLHKTCPFNPQADHFSASR